MDQGKIVDINHNSEIRKSRALLFAQTVPSNLPIAAQRLFLALLTSVNENSTNDDDCTFIIRGKDIANMANLSPNVVGQQLEEMSIKADFLRQYTLIIKEDDGNDLRVGLISSTKYLKGQRAIRVNIDKFLMPYLKKAKEQFVLSYTAAGPMKFKSEYSIRLFEMLNYYIGEGYHYFTLEELRTVFNLSKNKIPQTCNFNQKVLAPSMRDINTFTNLSVEVKQEKKSRTIVGYHFFFKNKNTDLTIAEAIDEKFIEQLISKPYNFNKVVLTKMIDKYGIESIKNNFRYAKQHNPSNFGAYLNWAITNQVYEKEHEIKQIEAVNKALKNNMVPPPQYSEQISIFGLDEQNTSEKDVDYERIKEENPRLFEVINRIQKKIEDKKD